MIACEGDVSLNEDQIREKFRNAFIAFNERALNTPSNICVSYQKLCHE